MSDPCSKVTKWSILINLLTDPMVRVWIVKFVKKIALFFYSKKILIFTHENIP